LARLARQIRNALERVQVVQKTSSTTSTSDTASRQSREASPALSPSAESAPEGIQSTQQPSTRTDPPTHVVDAMYRGDFPTITQAIAVAQPGDRILVRPGFYQEGLVLDKPLEIIGEGDLNLIVVQATGKAALLFKTTMGRVVNLTLRQNPRRQAKWRPRPGERSGDARGQRHLRQRLVWSVDRDREQSHAASQSHQQEWLRSCIGQRRRWWHN
jgi:hypothetical protein